MKQTIAGVRQSLKWAKEDVERKEKWGTNWMNLANDYKAKLEVATDRLQTIANGQYYPNEANSTDENDTKAKKTAVAGLKKISTMQQRNWTA